MVMTQKTGIELKFTRNQLLMTIAAVIIAGVVVFYFYLNFPSFPREITEINYYGVPVGFRADLREASKIPVYPSEDVLYYQLMNPTVQNITVAFKPATENNAYYSLEILEIVPKLKLAYTILGYDPKFENKPIELESYENLWGKIKSPIIAIIHPEYANETSVRYENHVIFISGTDLNNLDLATVKFLMVALDIKVD